LIAHRYPRGRGERRQVLVKLALLAFDGLDLEQRGFVFLG
jgi:hypothetical protein